MPFRPRLFDLAIDKGLLDAIFDDDSPDALASAQNLFAEVARCVRTALYVVSLAQAHILRLVGNEMAREVSDTTQRHGHR